MSKPVSAYDPMCADPRPISEFALQKFVVQLLALSGRKDVLWYHCPNGEHRSPRTGARLKAMGVVPGVADLCLVIDGKPYYLELKTGKGWQSQAQRSFSDRACKAGAFYAVARSPEAARIILEDWGAIPVDSASLVRRVA